MLTGQFSFDDEVGETKVELRDFSNRLIFELNTEVFPQKMDYKSDYKAMMADISEIIQNLAYDSLKDTFRRSKARLKGQATENEWWNILDALFDQLIINLGVIKRQPKHEIKKSEKVLPIEKIKSASKKNIEWFRKHSEYSNSSQQGIKVTDEKYFSHALSSKKYVTYDIYENRFIAWAVKNIIEQLRQYKKHVETAAGSNDYSPLINRLRMYQSRLQGLLHENPFNEVGKFEKRSHFSTSLTRGSGYRDFMHIYLLLTRGLELADNDIFKIEQKNISTLYEYWCFLKLVQILKEQNASKIDYQDLIKVRANNSCGSSSYSTLTLTKLSKKPAKPGTISGSVVACGPSTKTYSITAVPNATNYNWIVTGTGFTLLTGQGATSITVSVAAGFASGQVKVRAENCVGNSAYKVKNVKAAPAKPAAIFGQDHACISQTLPYSIAPVPGATSYTWTVNGGATFNGPTNGTNVLVKFSTAWSSYSQLRVQANSACASSAFITLFIPIDDKCRQMGDETLTTGINTYPNPTTGKLNISFDATGNEKYSFKVFDVIGNEVLSQNYVAADGSNLAELDLSTAAKGLYILRIEKENAEPKVMRIVVQ